MSYIPQEIFKKIMSYNLQPVNKFINGQYNNIYLETDISLIKKYIDILFGINCYLIPKVLIKNNDNIGGLIICCYKFFEKTQKPLIYIYPEERKFNYDSKNLHNNNNINTEIKIDETKYIQNNNIIKLFEEISIECQTIVHQRKIHMYKMGYGEFKEDYVEEVEEEEEEEGPIPCIYVDEEDDEDEPIIAIKK